jgi:hypothetical protein
MLQSVYGYIGKLFLKIVIHEVFGFVFRIFFAAGPAAEGYLCSGALDIKRSAAVKACVV